MTEDASDAGLYDGTPEDYCRGPEESPQAGRPADAS